VNLCGFLQIHNESERGNLRRCLNNMRQFCDDICIYDDGSTDDSVAVCREYTPHVILGGTRDFQRELFHKQQLLEYALTLNPDWIFWQDADEVVDRFGTTGGLRRLAETARLDIKAYGFKEVNMWRSERWARDDGAWGPPWFVRLWRVVPGMHIQTAEGLDRPSYPCHIKTYSQSTIRVVHYKFSDYKRLLWGAGLGNMTTEEFQKYAVGNFILDESNCKCYRVPDEWFPVENVPTGEWPEPTPIPISELKAYRDLP